MKKLFFSVFVGCLLCCAVGCSTSQKISVKQTQSDQSQQIEVEHTGTIQNLSLIFTNNSKSPHYEKS